MSKTQIIENKTLIYLYSPKIDYSLVTATSRSGHTQSLRYQHLKFTL